ncbi:unnamed protein product, partial [Prorocentrum cordatum]
MAKAPRLHRDIQPPEGRLQQGHRLIPCAAPLARRTRRTRRRRGGSRVVPSWGAARPSGSRPGRGRPRVLTKGSARCSAAGSITTSGASCSSGRLERLRGGAASGAHPRNALGEAQPSERTTRAKARRDST